MSWTADAGWAFDRSDVVFSVLTKVMAHVARSRPATFDIGFCVIGYCITKMSVQNCDGVIGLV